MGRYFAEMVDLVGGDEKAGRERKIEELHQTKGDANDYECGGKCWTLAQNHEAHSMERWSTDGCWTVVKQSSKNGKALAVR